jgi:hypothetical protein
LFLRCLSYFNHGWLVNSYFRLRHFYSLVIVLKGRRTERTVVRRAHIRGRHPRRMVREAASRRTSAPTAASAQVRRPYAASARHIVAAAGSLRVCRSHTKAKNKNCHRN